MLRVVQWSTGNVGRYALRAILEHPELELAGLWVHGPEKEGQDAGSLCGLPPTGVTATRDAEALLALRPDCVCYTATADLRPMEAVDEIARLLATGCNVVASSLVALVHPHGMGPQVHAKLADACRAGDSSLFVSGIDPGFANDLLPLLLSGLGGRIDELRVQEIVNYATYHQPEVVMGTMGFGQPLDSKPLLLVPGALRFAWGGTVRLLAEGLGLELDEIRETHERLPADESFTTPLGRVEQGTMAALRFEVQGIVEDRPVIVVEHVTRLRDEDAPHWPHGRGYRVIVKGFPGIRCDLTATDEKGDDAVGGVIVTATRLVNAIPAVCDAPARPLSPLDLPFISGRGLLRSSAR